MVLNEICRLCLDKGALTGIFKIEGKDMIFRKIMTLTELFISPNDGLPNKICMECLLKLNSCLDFIHICKSSDFKLRQLIKDNTDDTQYHIKEEIRDIENIHTKQDTVKNVVNEIKPIKKEIDDSNITDPPLKNRKSKRAQKEQCPTCGKVLSSKFRLKMHLRIHTGERPFSCSHCGKNFSLSQNLKVHLRIHTGEKPLECTICGSSFAHSSGLLAHRRKHSGVLPYKCTLCPRSFRTTGHLQYHIRRHTGETSYQCDMCARAFITRSELKQHILSHTGERPHACGACGARFARASNLRRHAAHRHNGEKPYTCNKCSHKFARKSDFERHKKKHENQKPN